MANLNANAEEQEMASQAESTFSPAEKLPKTPEELAAIAYLDLDVCKLPLHIESAEDLRRKAAAPQPKKKSVFRPKPVKDDFLAKLRLHRKRYGW